MTSALAVVLASLEEADKMEPREGPKWRPTKERAGVGGMRCNCCRPKRGARFLGHHSWRGRNDRYKNHRRF